MTMIKLTHALSHKDIWVNTDNITTIVVLETGTAIRYTGGSKSYTLVKETPEEIDALDLEACQ